MSLIRVLDYFAKFAGAVALLLGLAFWSGGLIRLIPLHVSLGVALVVCLWALATLGLRNGAGAGLVATAIVWGIVTVALGFGQTQLLPGELHWIVQLAHLLVGLGAIILSAMLARVARPRLEG